MTLRNLGNIPFRLSVLGAVFPENKAMPAKAKRLEDEGDIIRLKRGLYVVSPEISDTKIDEYLIANHLYGPSYVSMQTALRYHGLIPERVDETLSMTVGISKTFLNKIGRFRYVHCPDEYFSIGITSVTDGSVSFLVATPEKALCDLIAYTPNLNLRYSAEIREYIEENLRIDLDDIKGFNLEILRECALVGKKKKMISKLIDIIENERNV